MKNAFLSLLAVGLVAVSPLAAAQEFFWHANYNNALEEAKQTGKPILLAFRCVP